jgi:putative ABC transport system permease protein
MLDNVSSDLRAAVRTLAGRPGFTAVAVLTLALGIGANTAIFSVVHAVLLRPLPYTDADRLVRATRVMWEADIELTAAADYLDWRDQSRLFAGVAASTLQPATLQGTERPEKLQAARVSASFLPVLGVGLAQGRGFQPVEERLNGGPAAVVTDRFWIRRFGKGAVLDGQTIRIDDRVYPVIGVLAPGFQFPRKAEVEVLLPLALDEAVERARQRMTIVDVLGRMKPGVTVEQVRVELEGIGQRAETAALAALTAAAPEAPTEAPRAGPGGPRGGRGPLGLPEAALELTPLREWLVGDIRLELLVLLGAVGCVLLIACANVANLLLTRATARSQEIAIRAALGADRWRLARLLLAESALLGLLGGACGLLLAAAGVRPLVAMIPPELGAGLFRHLDIGLDAPVLLFTLALALATGLLFGLAPTLAASRPDLQEPLRQGPRGAPRSGLARGLVVAAEVAVAVVLLVGAGLLLRSFLGLQAVDLGFAPERVLTARVAVDPERYPSAAAQAGFFRELVRRARALPGVEAVTYADTLPLGGFTMIVRGMNAEGRPRFELDQAPEIGVTTVGPDYFRALGIRLLRGRAFEPSDGEGGQTVAVVSEGMARRLWGGEDPIGRRLTGGPSGGALVVGVVADVKHEGLEASSRRLQLYLSGLQQPRSFGVLAVRTKGDPARLAATLRREVQALTPDQPVPEISTLEDRLADSLAGRRFHLTLLGLFSLLALVLAGIGLYGVLSYAVAERTHELGIRMALGARRERVRGQVLRQGLVVAAAGAVAGLVLAFGAARLLRNSLYGITAADPVTFAAIPLLLLAVAALAAWLPASRATRVDPMIALRNEV